MHATLTPIFATVAALLVLAGARKLVAPAGAASALGVLGMPAPATLARALALAEIAIGAFAIVRPSVLSAALCACAYAIFAAALLRLRRVAPGVDCGCFGSAAAGRRGRSAGRFQIALDLLALAVCLLACATPPEGAEWLIARPPLQAGATVFGVGACVYGAYLCFTALPGAWAAYRGAQG